MSNAKTTPHRRVQKKRRALAADNPPAKVSEPAAQKTTAPPPPKTPHKWSEVEVGSLVIAFEDSESGWWEAIVTGVNKESVKIRWRDYPRQPEVTRAKEYIAYLDR